MHLFFKRTSGVDEKHVLFSRKSHGLFKMIFFFKRSLLATVCNKDLITLITAAHAQCATGAKKDACPVFELETKAYEAKQTSLFP